MSRVLLLLRNGSLLLAAALPLLAQQPRILRPIDDSRQTVLAKNVHPLAIAANDRGPVDQAMRLEYITMVFQPTAAQQADLESLLIQQQDRSSASFHRWLTPEQFGDRFGLAPGDVAAIRTWLESQGFRIVDTARGRNWIAFSGTAAQAQRALHTEIHRFDDAGQTRYANTMAPSVPSEIAGLVRFFRGLDNFQPWVPLAMQNPVPPAPAFTVSTGTHTLAPDDFAAIYDIMPLYNASIKGGGQSIAVLGRTDIDVPGYMTFRSTYNLPATAPVLHLVGPDPGVSASDLGEAMLDTEWAGAVARDATIIYVYSTSINDAAQEAVDKNLAPVISSSYSGCEPRDADVLRYLAQQANAQGVTWLVVTNDAGAAACEQHLVRQLVATGFAVSYPSTIPEITAVGGTEFNDAAGNYWASTNSATGESALGYIPEFGWNQNGAGGIFASGGGASIFYAKPFWQVGPGVPADGRRDVPDISMTGASHDGYRTYYNGAAHTASGTSAATPSLAGVIALMNQYELTNHFQATAGMGNINPELYHMAQAYPAAFHDITTGNNDVPCVQSSPDCSTGSFGYNAGPGYDQISGIGSVDVNNLITHWNQDGSPSTTAVTAAANSVAFGSKAQLTATVRPAAGGTAPAGTVSFLVPGLGNATPILGSSALAVSGGVATASISTDPNALTIGPNPIVAVYSGDANYNSSSGSTTVTVTPPANAAAIAVSVSPNPVYGQATTTGVIAWSYNLTLTEEAGVGATLTDFTIAGADEASRLSTFFSSMSIPPHGTLTGGVSSTGLTAPVNRIFTFSGVDANGHAWNQQIAVEFIAPILQPELLLTGRPAAVAKNTAASSCEWQQRLDVEELGGFTFQLTKFLAGGTDMTSQLTRVFGTNIIAPYGALQGSVCLSGATPPAAQTYEVDGVTDGGSAFRTTFATAYSGAASAPAALSAPAGPIAMSLPSNSGQTTAPLTIALSSSANWTAAISPQNPTTSWLKLSAASGTGPGALTLTASGAGQTPGVYRATVVVQGTNTVPQYTATPVTFTIGATSSISIGGVTNGASFQVAAAPGMLMSVFGTGLAPATQAASAVPLPLSLAGVSATVNGVAAPLYYVSPTQINLQVPYETGAGPAVVGIDNNGAVASFSFTVAPSAPGIFAAGGNLVPASAAARGGVLTMFITGEGAVAPALITGASPSATTPIAGLPAPILPITVTVGGIPANILFSGIPPALVGVTQVNFAVPGNAQTGVQPVVVTSNGVASAPVTITVTGQ
jgi:uncharacterized protein (TIGR03437 family)